MESRISSLLREHLTSRFLSRNPVMCKSNSSQSRTLSDHLPQRVSIREELVIIIMGIICHLFFIYASLFAYRWSNDIKLKSYHGLGCISAPFIDFVQILISENHLCKNWEIFKFESTFWPENFRVTHTCVYKYHWFVTFWNASM